jgi:hypothetical protein
MAKDLPKDFHEHNEVMKRYKAQAHLGKHKPGLYERRCLDCGTDKTRIKDAGKYKKRADGSDAISYPIWHVVEGGFICVRCYNRYRMRDLYKPVVFVHGRGGHGYLKGGRIQQQQQ